MPRQTSTSVGRSFAVVERGSAPASAPALALRHAAGVVAATSAAIIGRAAWRGGANRISQGNIMPALAPAPFMGHVPAVFVAS